MAGAGNGDSVKLHEYLAALHADAAVIDLRAPPRTEPPGAIVSDSEGGGGSVHGGRRGVKRERALVDDDESQGSAKREHHNKHTRRCRARLKGKFDALLATLPPPPGAREVKHKVQILDYAMDALRALDDELRALEWALALRSQVHLLRWVAASARGATDLSAAAHPVVELLCARMGFVYAETLRPACVGGNVDGTGVGAASPWFVERTHCQPHPWCGASTLERLAACGEAAQRQQHVIHPDICAPLSLSLERTAPVTHCGGPATGQIRPELAAPTALLVPVPVVGQVRRIIVLFDVRERTVGPECVRLATVVAAAVGNVFISAEHQRNIRDKAQVGARGAAARAKT